MTLTLRDCYTGTRITSCNWSSHQCAYNIYVPLKSEISSLFISIIIKVIIYGLLKEYKAKGNNVNVFISAGKIYLEHRRRRIVILIVKLQELSHFRSLHVDTFCNLFWVTDLWTNTLIKFKFRTYNLYASKCRESNEKCSLC